MARGLLGVRKGSWTVEEDLLLQQYIGKYGEGNWHQIPQLTGLNRCRKSCRLRWLNYVRPNIKRGQFTIDEVDLLIRLHKLLGNRWSLIAGRLPGRTANDIKNYWNTHIKKKFSLQQKFTSDGVIQRAITTTATVTKPKPWIFKGSLSWPRIKEQTTTIIKPKPWIFKRSFSLPMIKEQGMVKKPKEAVKGFWQESVLLEKLEDKFHHNSGIEAARAWTTISEEKDTSPIVLNEVESLRVEDEQNDWDEFFLDLSLWDVMSPNCGRIEGDTSQPDDASQSLNFNCSFIN
ncbi:hypothetical protein Nepgr_031665 [Nepenthes gracilis]|uniref:Transcription factor MYB1 n=1 Tax=Nepenthes gracilis TaxID=150966 RepID=A0AAD3TJ96_NEPGR|nr:hypothetical protein Nepgr_031665 [Nepenthes gracilis]